MCSHASAGAELLLSANVEHKDTAVSIARHHHEWWSGGGYPDGLAGESIPVAARITALAEAFDAMTHARSHRPKLPIERALNIISERAGHQFDPSFASVFCDMTRDLCLRHVDLDAHLERAAESRGIFRLKRRLSLTSVRASHIGDVGT
jgi:putative two-component system response regulator